jgi:hypothetical protein
VGRCGPCFQTARQHSTIGSMNIERRVKEARRKDKAAAKREKRQARRQQKAAAPVKS